MWGAGWENFSTWNSDSNWDRGTYGSRSRRTRSGFASRIDRQNRLDYLDALSEREWTVRRGDELSDRIDRPFEVHEVSLGGIHNGGNSCYLAAALQTANAIPLYRELFDPVQNQLLMGVGEGEERFALRCAVQRKAFRILKAITSGKSVYRFQINNLRKKCVEIGIIPSQTGMADAAEVLERLLLLMGYEEPRLACRVVDRPNEDAAEELLPDTLESGNLRDPENYSTVEELEEGMPQSLSLEVSAYAYSRGCVDMQTLIDTFWGEESLSNLVVKRRNDESGEWAYSRVHGVTRSKHLDEDAELPAVLRVTIQQHPTKKALIDAPLTIQATGTESGVESTYRLAAVIEHKARPPHYVAHLVGEDGSVIEADDGVVQQTNVTCLPGQAYYYLRVESDPE